MISFHTYRLLPYTYIHIFNLHVTPLYSIAQIIITHTHLHINALLVFLYIHAEFGILIYSYAVCTCII